MEEVLQDQNIQFQHDRMEVYLFQEFPGTGTTPHFRLLFSVLTQAVMSVQEPESLLKLHRRESRLFAVSHSHMAMMGFDINDEE